MKNIVVRNITICVIILFVVCIIITPTVNVRKGFYIDKQLKFQTLKGSNFSVQPTPSSEFVEEKLAYVFLLTNHKYEKITLKAIRSLRQHDNYTPIVVLTTGFKSKIINNVTYKQVKPKNFGRWQWRDTFAKFEVATLEEFDRVMFFDSDVIFYNSPFKHFFEDTAADVMAPYAYWLENGTSVHTTGGPFIVRPSKDLFKNVRSRVLRKSYDGEMDYFNEVLKRDLKTRFKTLLDPSYVLIGDYNTDERDVVNPIPPTNYTLVHFVAWYKPPLPETKLKKLSSTIQKVYSDWAAL